MKEQKKIFISKTPEKLNEKNQFEMKNRLRSHLKQSGKGENRYRKV